MFVTFEGPEGSGKTTQVRILGAKLRSLGLAVVTTFEPGGTGVGDEIRRLVLTPRAGEVVSARSEALLFAAARAQLVHDVIRPALDKGAAVLCDRFSDSTFAYQVGGRGLPLSGVQTIVDFATEGLKPNLSFLLDLSVTDGFSRKGGQDIDRLEREEIAFHERVRDYYARLAKNEPNRIVQIDATLPVDEVARRVYQCTYERLVRTGAIHP